MYPRQRHQPCHPAPPRHFRPKGNKRRNARQQPPLLDHMQPPRGKVGGQPPLCRSANAVKPDRQVVQGCTARITFNLKPTDRASVIIQNAGISGGRCFNHVADIAIPTSQTSDALPRGLATLMPLPIPHPNRTQSPRRWPGPRFKNGTPNSEAPASAGAIGTPVKPEGGVHPAMGCCCGTKLAPRCQNLENAFMP